MRLGTLRRSSPSIWLRPWRGNTNANGNANANTNANGYGFCTSASASTSTSTRVDERIIAAVALERLPVIIPPTPPEVSQFKNFSFQYHQQFRRHYPAAFTEFLSSSGSKEDNALELDFEPAPRITEADKSNDRRSLDRALDRRLFLIVKGYPAGGSRDKEIWHFPERVYNNEETLRQCAESVLIPDLAQPKDVYYVGNAPCGHMCGDVFDKNTEKVIPYKRFFFRSRVLRGLELEGWDYTEYAWVTKDEIPEYFESDQSEYMKKMLVDDLLISH